jgi:hypothetical protein
MLPLKAIILFLNSYIESYKHQVQTQIRKLFLTSPSVRVYRTCVLVFGSTPLAQRHLTRQDIYIYHPIHLKVEAELTAET